MFAFNIFSSFAFVLGGETFFFTSNIGKTKTRGDVEFDGLGLSSILKNSAIKVVCVGKLSSLNVDEGSLSNDNYDDTFKFNMNWKQWKWFVRASSLNFKDLS